MNVSVILLALFLVYCAELSWTLCVGCSGILQGHSMLRPMLEDRLTTNILLVRIPVIFLF